jgi:peptidoglycan/xylan/chitin deacetylase (PgdA/CDA1 family)
MHSAGDGPVPWTEPTLVVSLDFELAWGSFDHAHGPELLEMARWTHDHGAPALLDLLTRNGLSATWATVGVAMLDRLPDTAGLAPFSAGGRDWFSFVPPGATEATAPEWFAASFVRELLRATPRQEVGFHGFSHVVLGDPALPAARARQELERCAELARRLGIEAPSFVFPRNSIAHLDALRSAGIACYRGVDEVPLPLPGRRAQRLWWLAADVLGLPPPIVRPRIDGGLVDVPGSLMVRYAGGWRRRIPDRVRLRRLRTGLRRLRARGGIFHVWLHPENLFFERPRLERVLADFLAEAGELAAAGRIEVLTMGEVARAALARAAPAVREAR